VKATSDEGASIEPLGKSQSVELAIGREERMGQGGRREGGRAMSTVSQ